MTLSPLHIVVVPFSLALRGYMPATAPKLGKIA
jgi:hypothetical protein